MLINYLFNVLLCKIISFLLTCFTRLCFWLTCLVSIERVYVTIYTKGIWLKKPNVAKCAILATIIFVFGSHSHELIYYDIVQDPKYTKYGTWCVTQYNQILSVYNQTITILHYILPCIINLTSTFILIIQIAHKRANTNRDQSHTSVLRQQFQQYKELFIPPFFILVSALPQFIISFSLACTEINIAWQRYLLMVAYFLSYVPQLFGYILFILPSALYKTEFYSTTLGRRLAKLINKAT
ncbi:unnamed protein product [Didymodactylos carnosus]|uniref:G-protein coupled receptors family 1 profile domain-containing protein n=1 Tax=Didymodactylos carnosus TaxID=1234261 RepID=A0A814ZNC3_9BILA|nr:unnamed protein product [Didymodactylos carnosus]CAF1246157.1 unnamed protein product [Didymodactylos carnosus]CAF3808265.1 unnamed protein product [Didymodactylos carnosus]CAF4012159.1 unnamed protein product [Didymodactylos carnosus]